MKRAGCSASSELTFPNLLRKRETAKQTSFHHGESSSLRGFALPGVVYCPLFRSTRGGGLFCETVSNFQPGGTCGVAKFAGVKFAGDVTRGKSQVTSSFVGCRNQSWRGK